MQNFATLGQPLLGEKFVWVVGGWVGGFGPTDQDLGWTWTWPKINVDITLLNNLSLQPTFLAAPFVLGFYPNFSYYFSKITLNPILF
jgi:hypothetical protein